MGCLTEAKLVDDALHGVDDLGHELLDGREQVGSVHVQEAARGRGLHSRVDRVRKAFHLRGDGLDGGRPLDLGGVLGDGGDGGVCSWGTRTR